jgi:hypothetical protein
MGVLETCSSQARDVESAASSREGVGAAVPYTGLNTNFRFRIHFLPVPYPELSTSRCIHYEGVKWIQSVKALPQEYFLCESCQKTGYLIFTAWPCPEPSSR